MGVRRRRVDQRGNCCGGAAIGIADELPVQSLEFRDERIFDPQAVFRGGN